MSLSGKILFSQIQSDSKHNILFLISSQEIILYKLQVGNFEDYDLKDKVHGMKLLNYFPLYMHDTDTAVIPDMVRGHHQQPLVISTPYAKESESLFESVKKTNILETVNPNTDQDFFAFFLKHALPEDLPFLDRSFVLKFDILSFADIQGSIKSSFTFFQLSFFLKETNKFMTLVFYCVFDLNRVMLLEKPHYQGKISFYVVFEYSKVSSSSLSLAEESLGSYDVLLSASNNDGLNNFYEDPFLKTKYKENNFFFLMRPQTVMFNVSPVYNSRYPWTL